MTQEADLYHSGLTLHEIGRQLGISHVAVWARLNKQGLERRRGGPRSKPIADYAFRVGDGEPPRINHTKRWSCYHRELKLVAWRAVFPLTDDERQLVRECLDVDGLSFPDTIEVLEDYRK